MILWINGAFGAGKTTLSEALQSMEPDILVVDPEEVGFAVRQIFPPAPSGDFQDLAI